MCLTECAKLGYSIAGTEYGDEVSVNSCAKVPVDLRTVLLRQLICRWWRCSHLRLQLQHALLR